LKQIFAQARANLTKACIGTRLFEVFNTKKVSKAYPKLFPKKTALVVFSENSAGQTSETFSENE
jgi:hypothetical protein